MTTTRRSTTADHAPTMKLKDAARDFLAQRRIAVTGVSRSPKDHGANVVYKRLRERGYQVFAVNPATDTVEGDPCWPDLGSIPGGVDAVVIATSPDHAETTVQQCIALGIRRVWMHHSIDGTSVSPTAVELGRTHGIQVIDGACPCMFAPATDPGHRIMKNVLRLAGKVPRRV